MSNKADIKKMQKRIENLKKAENKQLLLNQKLIKLYVKALYAKY